MPIAGGSVAWVLTVLVPTTALSQRAPATETRTRAPAIERIVDSIVTAEALAHGVPGVGVAIVSKGRTILARGYGLADRATKLPATDSTSFNIASVTKPFTSALALRLARRGIVDLDAPVRRYLPWMPEIYRDITLRHLLTHTSGIVRDVRRDNDDDPDAAEYRSRVVSSSPSFSVGERFEYSNTGYTVLGWALEASARQPLDALFMREMFTPFGMRTASYRARPGATRARPYRVTRERQVAETAWISGGFGSGGIALSATDAASFAAALQRGRVLQPSEEQQAWSPAKLRDGTPVRARAVTAEDSYGFGWWISKFEGRRLLSHGGGITGFSAFVWHFPDEALTIFVLANVKARDDGAAPVDPILRQIVKACRATQAC